MNRFKEEIYEQPSALKDTLKFYRSEPGKAILKEIYDLWRDREFRQVLFTGMGSSYFAGYMGTGLLSSCGIPSYVINAGELLHYHRALLKEETLLVCISQSGESYETVKIMEALPGEIACIGITNDEKSSLAARSRITLLCRAGREEMTSTKTYVSTLLSLVFFANALAGPPDKIPESEINKVIEITGDLIGKEGEWLPEAMDFIGQPAYLQMIGRGPVYATVLQSALMFKEAAGTPAAGITGGEFRHGPLEMVQEGFIAVVFAPAGETYGQMHNLVTDIVKFGGKVVWVTNQKNDLDKEKVFKVYIPCDNEYLFPLPAVIPLQYMADRWAFNRGNEPGRFTHGAKVTSIE